MIESSKPLNRCLQQGILAQQRDELLGMVFTRQRPKSGAGTAREDYGNYAWVHGLGRSRSFHVVCISIILEPFRRRRPKHRTQGAAADFRSRGRNALFDDIDCSNCGAPVPDLCRTSGFRGTDIQNLWHHSRAGDLCGAQVDLRGR